MRHLKAGRKLGRNASHRDALMRNLARALILHGRIITTVEKAKELRPFIEKLITLAKQGTLHSRRLAIARLHDKEMVKRLFTELAERYQDRAGGYTRVIKRHERRLGDGGKTAFIELLKAGERKTQKKAPAPAPAPRLAEPTPQPPAPPEPVAMEPAAPPPTPAPETPETPPPGQP
jgi:large subunit ribosomal protein L17